MPKRNWDEEWAKHTAALLNLAAGFGGVALSTSNPEDEKWAKAIAGRIADEYGGEAESDDLELLAEVLDKCFQANPAEMRRLIGTVFIQTTYFEDLANLEAVGEEQGTVVQFRKNGEEESRMAWIMDPVYASANKIVLFTPVGVLEDRIGHNLKLEYQHGTVTMTEADLTRYFPAWREFYDGRIENQRSPEAKDAQVPANPGN